MCDCYKVGGPWIAEDPDCPIHGNDAQRQQAMQDERSGDFEDRIAQLEIELGSAMRRIEVLESTAAIGAKK